MNFEEHGEVSWVMKEDLFSGMHVCTCIHTIHVRMLCVATYGDTHSYSTNLW